MTKHHPTHPHDYLPAAGKDGYLPWYDLLTRALGVGTLHRRLVDQAGITAGQRVLEIGCGTGNLTLRASRACQDAELVGTDPDPLALARAQRRTNGGRVRYERAYAQDLPYPDGSFDRVLSALMLHHLDEDTRAAALTEVARVLRPGGSVHIADFTGELAGAHGFLARRLRRSGHVADGIPRLLTAAGLQSVEVMTTRHRIMGGVAFYRATRPAR